MGHFFKKEGGFVVFAKGTTRASVPEEATHVVSGGVGVFIRIVPGESPRVIGGVTSEGDWSNWYPVPFSQSEVEAANKNLPAMLRAGVFQFIARRKDCGQPQSATAKVMID